MQHHIARVLSSISKTSLRANTRVATLRSFNFSSASFHGYKKALPSSFGSLSESRSALDRVSLRRRYLSSYPKHVVVPMPALSPTMESGSIAKWNLKEGDRFEAGQSICEVETDKATVTYEATDEGYIAKILVGSGEIKVGQPMMVTVDDLGDVSAFSSFSVVATPPPSAPSSSSSAAPQAQVQVVSAPLPVPLPLPVPTSAVGKVFASPLAKKLAREASPQIDLSLLGTGSGPNGRIIAADVQAAPAKLAALSQAVPAVSALQASLPPSASGLSIPTGMYSDFEASNSARDFAAKLTHAKQVVPHYYLSVELNLEKIMKLRATVNKDKSSGLSVMDFIIKASALAMKEVPDVNGAWMDSFVRRYEQVDINIVMGSGSALTTPVIKDVTSKGLRAISDEVASFEDDIFSEDGKLIDASKVSTGTFSIHNLGVYGVKSVSPIVLPPQSCALALGSVIDTVVPNDAAKEGEDNWKVSPIVVATLSCDHRVVDGAVGAQWLAAFKELVEDPINMLL